MKFTYMTPRHAALVLAVCGGLVLSGCAGGMSDILKPKGGAIEQVVVPVPAPAITQATIATATTQAAPLTPSIIPKREDIALAITYMERILVPVGSTLTVRADGAGSGPPSIKSTKVQAGPPYDMTLPVDIDAGAYPMTVQATLTSTIGHVLTGAVTLSAPPVGVVDITLRTTAQ